ncbi:hypothetical protein LSO9J_10055 [Candidatus Liberibacter solanacearum]
MFYHKLKAKEGRVTGRRKRQKDVFFNDISQLLYESSNYLCLYLYSLKLNKLLNFS